MDTPLSLNTSDALVLATVVGLTAGVIECADPQGRRYEADLLYTSDKMPLTLAPGDRVLLLPDPNGALIIGRVGESKSPHASATQGPEDELVLEAKSNLTLKCGEGSITIRNDGKILIKGKNLVSTALETNRIKGGAVSIN